MSTAQMIFPQNALAGRPGVAREFGHPDRKNYDHDNREHARLHESFANATAATDEVVRKRPIAQPLHLEAKPARLKVLGHVRRIVVSVLSHTRSIPQ